MVQKIDQHELVCATTFLFAKIGLPHRTLPPHTSLKQSIVGYISAACGPESPTAGATRLLGEYQRACPRRASDSARIPVR